MKYLKNSIYIWKLDRDKIEEIDPTLYSSFIFLTNSIIAFYISDVIYSLLFVFLFFTSIMYRITNKHAYMFIIDKLAIISVVFYGGYTLYLKLHRISLLISFIITVSFLLTIYLFYYGYHTQTLCYDKNKEKSNTYHSLLHLLSSAGHHLILLS